MARHDALRQEEIDFIQKHKDDMSLGELATSLGRSYYTIQKHTSAIGHHPTHRWNDEEDALLRELWGKYCAEYIARRLKIDTSCVYNRVRRLRKNGKFFKNDSKL